MIDRNGLIAEVVQSWIDRFDPGHDTQHFDTNIGDRDRLIVCLGDSWTFGNSLPEEERSNLIYGRLLADEIDADLINVGMCGYSNSAVLHFGQYLSNQADLAQHWPNIWLVVTLTENGRDTESPFGFAFDYIKYFSENAVSVGTYQNLLSIMEQSWYQRIRQIRQLLPQAKIFVGQNFVSHPGYQTLAAHQVLISDSNWIEQIALQGNLPLPPRADMVTGWVIDQFGRCNDIGQVSDRSAFQEFCLPYLDRALMVNQWLDSSPFNSKMSSKHPNAQAHQFWKKHILETMNHEQ